MSPRGASAINESLVQSNGGTFSLAGADRTFTVADGPAGIDLEIDAPIIGTGTERLLKDGPGVMGMGGSFANSYAGITTVRNDRFELGKTGTIAIAGPLAIGDGAGDHR